MSKRSGDPITDANAGKRRRVEAMSPLESAAGVVRPAVSSVPAPGSYWTQYSGAINPWDQVILRERDLAARPRDTAARDELALALSNRAVWRHKQVKVKPEKMHPGFENYGNTLEGLSHVLLQYGTCIDDQLRALNHTPKRHASYAAQEERLGDFLNDRATAHRLIGLKHAEAKRHSDAIKAFTDAINDRNESLKKLRSTSPNYAAKKAARQLALSTTHVNRSQSHYQLALASRSDGNLLHELESYNNAISDQQSGMKMMSRGNVDYQKAKITLATIYNARGVINNKIAKDYHEQGFHDTALPYFDQAIIDQRKSCRIPVTTVGYEVRKGNINIILNNKANCCECIAKVAYNTQRYQEALDAIKNAIHSREKTLANNAPDNPDTIDKQISIGVGYHNAGKIQSDHLGKHDEAVVDALKALEILLPLKDKEGINERKVALETIKYSSNLMKNHYQRIANDATAALGTIAAPPAGAVARLAAQRGNAEQSVRSPVQS